jgi:hypothetical protein
MKPQFNINSIVKKLKFNVIESCLDYIQELSKEDFDIKIDYDVYLPTYNHNLQREFCWDLLQKQELILSLLKEIKIPKLSVLYLKDKRIYQIIDGKQRLSTIISFYKNEFPINVNGFDYFYNDLDKTSQMNIRLFNFTINIAYVYDRDIITDDDKMDWYDLLNFAGTAQDKEHINNIKKNKTI